MENTGYLQNDIVLYKDGPEDIRVGLIGGISKDPPLDMSLVPELESYFYPGVITEEHSQYDSTNYTVADLTAAWAWMDPPRLIPSRIISESQILGRLKDPRFRAFMFYPTIRKNVDKNELKDGDLVIAQISRGVYKFGLVVKKAKKTFLKFNQHDMRNASPFVIKYNFGLAIICRYNREVEDWDDLSSVNFFNLAPNNVAGKEVIIKHLDGEHVQNICAVIEDPLLIESESGVYKGSVYTFQDVTTPIQFSSLAELGETSVWDEPRTRKDALGINAFLFGAQDRILSGHETYAPGDILFININNVLHVERYVESSYDGIYTAPVSEADVDYLYFRKMSQIVFKSSNKKAYDLK